ncbi:MAG: hypothetical protein ACPIGG_06520 [Akkermansiaceae bacterium]
MYFIRKRKHERDQKAGLIFHWRGFRKHHSGKVVGLILAAAFFAFSVYAIKVETPRSPLQSKKEGIVVVLREDDPAVRALLLEVEDRSPFPARWEPAMDAEVLGRIAQKRSDLEGSLWNYEMKLEQLPVTKPTRGLISIAASQSKLFDPLPDHWQDYGVKERFIERQEPLIRVRVVTSEALKSRISAEKLELPRGLIVDESFGQVYRFQISLDADGFVSNCLPLPGGTTDSIVVTERQKTLAAWIRMQRFSQDEKQSEGMVVGELDLQIEALRQ